MSRHRITVVLSQGQGKNPAKRSLEESVAAALIMEPGLDVCIVPHLYDLDENHTGRMFLDGVRGDMVVLAWLFPRAAFWVLDRDGIKGHFGENQIAVKDEDEDEGEKPTPKGIGVLNVPDRHADALGHRLLALVLVVILDGDLILAEVPLDAVAVHHPERRAREQPGQDDHVAANAVEEQSPCVVLVEVIEVRHDAHLEARLHDERGGNALLERPLRRVLALALRQNDRDSMTTHGEFNPR